MRELRPAADWPLSRWALARVVCAWAAVVLSGDALGAQTSAVRADALYVCVQDEAKIAVVDPSTQTLLRTIDLTRLGFSPTAKPHHIQVSPDGAFVYVSLIGENKVIKLDAQDRVVGQYLTEVPGMLSLTPSGEQLLVSRSMSAVSPPSRVAIVTTASMEGEEVGVLFPRPHPMVATASGFAYTGSLGTNQLASVELATGRAEIVNIEGPAHSLVQFRVSPDARTLVASTDRSGQLLVFDLAERARPRLVKSIEVGAMAFDPVFTPDGRFVYVPVKSTNEIVVVDASSWTVARRIQGAPFKQPHQVVFSADGRFAFVSNNNKSDHMADPAMAGHEMPGGPASLVVLDVATDRVVKTLELGLNLTGMGTRDPLHPQRVPSR